MQISTRTKNKWPWQEHEQMFLLRMFLFIIWPFGVWVSALFNCNKKSAFIIFFLFDLLLLWHMSPTGYNSGYHDFLSIMDRFQTNNISFDDLIYNLKEYFCFSNEAPKEIYEDILTWITKTFVADNYHFYFMFAAIPVAYCQLNILHRVIADNRSKMCFALLVVLILLIIPRDIIGTQNPRFTTGFWVCVMSSISYFSDNQKLRYIFLVLLSPIFHSGMWPFVILFFVGIIIQKVERPLEIAAYISIPFMFIDANLFRNINFDFLPIGVAEWASRYMSDEYYARLVVGDEKSGFWWVEPMFKIPQKIIYIYMTFKLIKEKNEVRKNIESAQMYSFYLLIFTVVNMIQFVPELGNRYWGFMRIFCVFIWYKAFYPRYNKVLFVLLGFTCWYIINRYGYVFDGALSVNTPIDIFFMPLPYLVGKGLWW